MNKDTTINSVTVELSVRVGRSKMTVGEIEKLNVDSIIELNANLDCLELLAGDQVIAKGHLHDVDGEIKFTVNELI